MIKEQNKVARKYNSNLSINPGFKEKKTYERHFWDMENYPYGLYVRIVCSKLFAHEKCIVAGGLFLFLKDRHTDKMS